MNSLFSLQPFMTHDIMQQWEFVINNISEECPMHKNGSQ